MARAIVTYARGWHTLAVTRSLGKQGIDVYCGEEALFAPCFFSRYTKAGFQYPSVEKDPEGFIQRLLEKVIEFKPPAGEPYVLFPMHKETWLIAKHRELFEPHISLPFTSYENMALTHDKGKLALLAEKEGIDIPKTWQFTHINDLYRALPEMSFPMFLKMREGASGVGLKKVNTAEELIHYFNKFVTGYELSPEEYPLVQDYINGQDYCVTALFDHGKCVASMTYHNVRSFPRGTGAGVLRETAYLPEAEIAAQKLLSGLKWHGMVQLDFRKAQDGPAYLIEVNPRFFGGLPQAIAANVDYPHMLYQIACGEKIVVPPEIDYSARTEAPVVGFCATVSEIIHDKKIVTKYQQVREGWHELLHTRLANLQWKPFLSTLWECINPKNIFAYLREKFIKHKNTINDVLRKDDPAPILGIFFPIALMIQYRKLSMGVIVAEQELSDKPPKKNLKEILQSPNWSAILLTTALFLISLVVINVDITKNNLGILFAWPLLLAENAYGAIDTIDISNVTGALQYSAYHTLNLLYLYVLSAILLTRKRYGQNKEPQMVYSAG